MAAVVAVPEPEAEPIASVEPVARKKHQDWTPSPEERAALLSAHGKWRSAIDKDPVASVDKSHPAGEDLMLSLVEQSKPLAWTTTLTHVNDWITTLELLECALSSAFTLRAVANSLISRRTQLQSLLLLTLISLSPIPTKSPLKVKKKKDPERHAATLDPELLLDFLTDRLQIWRLMKDVQGLGGLSVPADGGLERERDKVQEWWEDIVEVLYASCTPVFVPEHC